VSVLRASLLLSAAALGLGSVAIGAIVRALRQVGEDHAGRLFAVETAIAHGL